MGRFSGPKLVYKDDEDGPSGITAGHLDVNESGKGKLPLNILGPLHWPSVLEYYVDPNVDCGVLLNSCFEEQLRMLFAEITCHTTNVVSLPDSAE